MRPIDAEELKMRVRDLTRKIARENGGVDDVTVALKAVYDMIDDTPSVSAADSIQDEGEMILCKHCGKQLDQIGARCFNCDSSDSLYMFDVGRVINDAVVFELPASWCGYELSEDEAMETIICPHCGEFPFSDSAGLNQDRIVRIVCFSEEPNMHRRNLPAVEIKSEVTKDRTL